MVLIGLLTADRSAAALAAMTTLQSRLLDLIAGIPTLRALGRADGPEHRIAELAAAHRRSTMATLRIAFLSALVLELLATLGVALVAVSVGLRLVFGEIELAAGLTALLLAPEVFWPLRRVGAEFHAAQDGRPPPTQRSRCSETLPAAGTGTRQCRRRCDPPRRLSVAARDGAARTPQRGRPAGQVTVLTGPNGAGKSTALHADCRVAEPRGRVIVGGVPTSPTSNLGVVEPDRLAAAAAGADPGHGAREPDCSGRWQISKRLRGIGFR